MSITGTQQIHAHTLTHTSIASKNNKPLFSLSRVKMPIPIYRHYRRCLFQSQIHLKISMNESLPICTIQGDLSIHWQKHHPLSDGPHNYITSSAHVNPITPLHLHPLSDKHRRKKIYIESKARPQSLSATSHVKLSLIKPRLRQLEKKRVGGEKEKIHDRGHCSTGFSSPLPVCVCVCDWHNKKRASPQSGRSSSPLFDRNSLSLAPILCPPPLVHLARERSMHVCVCYIMHGSSLIGSFAGDRLRPPKSTLDAN